MLFRRGRAHGTYEKLSMIERKNILGRNMREYIGDVISNSATLMALQAGREITLEQRHYSSGRNSLVTSKPVFQNGKIQFVISSNRDFAEITSLQQENTWRALLSKDRGIRVKGHAPAISKVSQMVSVSSSLAQQESISISQNLRRGALMRMKNGTFRISQVPYGYRRNEIG